jgi:hypothetical protein
MGEGEVRYTMRTVTRDNFPKLMKDMNCQISGAHTQRYHRIMAEHLNENNILTATRGTLKSPTKTIKQQKTDDKERASKH